MEKLTALITIVLAVSLATDRLVTLIKSLIPQLADDPPVNPLVEENEQWKYWRKIAVQVIAFLAAWLTCSFLADKESCDFIQCITISDDFKLPVVVVALLSMGGSAFWSDLLGWAKAVKDIKKMERAKEQARFSSVLRAVRATTPGVTTVRFIITHHRSNNIQRFRINSTQFDRAKIDSLPTSALPDDMIEIKGDIDVLAPLGMLNAELEAVGAPNRGGSFNIEYNNAKLIKPKDKEFLIPSSGRIFITENNIALA
jgi:hypothetical protein